MPSKKITAKKAAGRPALDPSDSTVPVVIRMTTGQRSKLARLGEAAGTSSAQYVRDHIDSTRDDSPLRKADDAFEIDTTHHSIDSQTAIVVAMAHERMHLGETQS